MGHHVLEVTLKQKIAKVAGAQLEVNEHTNKIEIRGNDRSCDRAKEYVELVLAQRIGPVRIDMQTPRPDMTVVDVPRDCVGYVTGRGGQVLRSLEAEWGTLMFFAKDKNSEGSSNDIEKLAIFGSRRSRRGAELKVMSAVEHKSPGFFLDGTKLRKELKDGEPSPSPITLTLTLTLTDHPNSHPRSSRTACSRPCSTWPWASTRCPCFS